MRLPPDEPLEPTGHTVGTGRYGITAQTCPRSAATQPGPEGYIRLEIRSDRLYSLLDDKALVVEDLRGLDRKATQWIRQCLLQTLRLHKQKRR
jgi:hypothetical protein